MERYKGIWLPDGEVHLKGMFDNAPMIDGKATYQIHKYNRAIEFCKQFRGAIDIGGFIGQWSMQMAKAFDDVYAFEPVSEYIACFKENVLASNVVLFQSAASNELKRVSMHNSTPGSHGDTWVTTGDDVQTTIIDNYGFINIDFIKADCEGYEYFALKGCEELLKRCKPVVIVEQKPGMAQKFGLDETQAVNYLKSLGAVLQAEIHGDYILSWE